MIELDQVEPEQKEHAEPLSLITSAEIDAQVATAKRYPRILSKVRSRAIEMATHDVETAQSCIYSVPRAGKKLTGPSIRFAEIIAAAWGNLRVAGRVLGHNDKTISVEALCHDLENNVAWRIQKERRITNKEGVTFNDDMIVVTGNAATSIALRDAVLRVIPKSEQKIVFDKVRAVAIGEPGTKTFADRRDDAMKYFKSLGIDAARVLAVVDRPKAEDLDMDDLETLTGLKTMLKNKETTPEEAFPVPQDPTKEMKIGGPK